MKKNFYYQFLGQGFGKLFMFLFYIALPRFMSKEDYGSFSYALTVCFLFGQPVIELGLDNVITKWVSRGHTGVFKKALNIRAISSISGFLVLLLLSYIFNINRQILFILFFYLVAMAFQNCFFSYLRGKEKMALESILVPSQKALSLLLLFVAVYLGFKGPFLASLPLLISSLISVTVLLFIFNSGEGSSKQGIAGENSFSSILKEGLVLGMVTFMWIIYFRIDSFMLGLIKGDAEVGIYNAAYRLMEGVFFIPSTIMLVSFPKLSRKTEFKRVFKKLFYKLLALGLSASIIVYVSAPYLIQMLYPQDFLSSARVLQILSGTIFFVFLGHLITQSLVAYDLSNILLSITFLGACSNILLNMFLIPRYGSSGAAFATVLTECLISIIGGGFIYKKWRKL